MATAHESEAGTHDIRDRLARGRDLPADEVVDLIVRDQERRWRRGERVLAETYFGAHPATADPDCRMDLIYAEVLLRESLGEQPRLAEYVFRFPDLADRIRALFQLHLSLADEPAADRPLPAPASPATPPPAGAIDLPGYDVLEELGRGGMGIVYKARDRELGRAVAVKVLRSDGWGGDWETRLRREAEALARVQHPNIVQIFDVSAHQGQPYLVLEYIGGGTLADRLRTGPVPPREAAGLIRAVALAVQAAHEQGVVHRDLKPANVLLADSSANPGREAGGTAPTPPASRPGFAAIPKVTDFGLAKWLDQGGLSRTGEMIGTPSYMAPEQAAGNKEVGPAADVYALGAVLYESLTGRPPFQGDTALSVLMQVANTEPVPPCRLRPGVPRDLETICLKCLEKEPPRRYASAAELADDLGRFLGGQPVRARPVSVIGQSVKLVRRHPLPAGLLALVLASLAAGLAGVLWQWRHAVRARGDAEIAARAESDQRRRAEQSLYHGRITQAALLWENGEVGQARDILAACRPPAGEEDWRGWEWHYLNRLFHPEGRVILLNDWVSGLAPCPPVPGRPDELAVAVGRPRPNLRNPSAPGGGTAGFLDPTEVAGILRPGPAVPAGALAAAAQPGGPLVAWGTADGHIVLGDRLSGQLVRTIALSSEVASLCFTPDGGRLIAGGTFDTLGQAWVLDPATGERVAEHTFDAGGTCLVAAHRPVSCSQSAHGPWAGCGCSTCRRGGSSPNSGIPAAASRYSVFPRTAASSPLRVMGL
jgi:serine/threonine protein kinase